MRKNLKILRVKEGMTQEEFAKRIGVARQSYSAVENGVRSGKQQFWDKIKSEFNVPDSDMWELMLNE